MNILQIISVVIELIKLAEKVMPESGKGSEKVKFVRQIIESIFGDVSDNWDTIQSAIDLFVSIYNKLGIFKKG